MDSPECPVPGCSSTGFEIIHMEGVGDLLVCNAGHVISRDYSRELAKIAKEISDAVNGVSATVAGHTEGIRNDIKEAVSVLSKKG